MRALRSTVSKRYAVRFRGTELRFDAAFRAPRNRGRTNLAGRLQSCTSDAKGHEKQARWARL